jgi:hypothetical protein
MSSISRTILVITLVNTGVGCTTPFEPSPWLVPAPRTKTTDAAAAHAAVCGLAQGQRVVRPYETLRLWSDDRTTLGGYTQGRDVVVRADLWGHSGVIAHEFIHAMLDVHDHPPIFERCGVAASQF